MTAKPVSISQLSFYSTFEEQLSHRHPLYILANQIRWNMFEEAFADLYSEEGPLTGASLPALVMVCG